MRLTREMTAEIANPTTGAITAQPVASLVRLVRFGVQERSPRVLCVLLFRLLDAHHGLGTQVPDAAPGTFDLLADASSLTGLLLG
jgi:hypothetical protein